MQQIPFTFKHVAAFNQEDFLISSANIEAVKMLDCYPKWPSHAVLIYGDKGCGKTHLAHIFIKKTGGKTPLVYAKDLIKSDIPELLGKSGNLVVEDIENTADEATLLHLYNYTNQTGGHILFTSDKAPADLQVKLPDLRSRLMAITATHIGNPDDVLMKSLLVKLFTDRQLDISEETLDYAIKNIERSFQSINALVDTADKLSLTKQQAITIPLLREIFKQTQKLKILSEPALL